jgi:hypothetical protein
MSNIGSWDPKLKVSQPASEVNLNELSPFLALNDSQLDTLSASLTQEVILAQRHLMTRHKNAWKTVAAQLKDQQVIDLIRFFTLAEGQLPGWEAGSKSPVIWLCRELKKRGLFPDQALIKWIKTHTDNKFLPYGNPLDF